MHKAPLVDTNSVPKTQQVPYHSALGLYNRDGTEPMPSAPPEAGQMQRVGYGEDERTFIMICTVLRGMEWCSIEAEFSAWFPPGQMRRNKAVGLPPFYPQRARTARDLLRLYYRIRKEWGLPRI